LLDAVGRANNSLVGSQAKALVMSSAKHRNT